MKTQLCKLPVSNAQEVLDITRINILVMLEDRLYY
jgi:hypothetical protein